MTLSPLTRFLAGTALAGSALCTSSVHANPTDFGTVSEPRSSMRDDDRYDVTINGEPQGTGTVLRTAKALYLEVVMARAANLVCGPVLTRNGLALCAIQAVKVSITDSRADVTVSPKAFVRNTVGKPADLPKIPEMAPSNLAFLNYDLAPSLIQGDFGFTGTLRGGLRLGVNAFDLGAVVTHTASGGVLASGGSLLALGDGSTSLLVTDAAYRRYWFEDRLTVAIGRSSLQQRGFLTGNLFDGLGLTRDNYDNQGNVRSSLTRTINGYNPSAGVLTYRLGTTVLKQVPLAAGPYTIDPALFAGLPPGGQIEIAGYDGRVTSLSLTSNVVGRLQSLYKAGTWDANLQVGRLRTAAGTYVAGLEAGSRYGLSDAVTVEAATLADTHSAALDASLDVRLPYNLGVAGVTGAAQWRSLNDRIDWADQRRFGWSLEGYYEKGFGKVTLGADYLRNADGGIIIGGYRGAQHGLAGLGYLTGIPGAIGTYTGTPLGPTSAGLPLLGSLLAEDVQVYANVPLFRTSYSGSVRLRSSRYLGEPQRARYVEAQLSGGMGRWGNVSGFARVGRDGYGHDDLSLNVAWTVPLGVGHNVQAGISYQTDRSDGLRTGPDRYALTVSGSTASHWNQSNQFNVQVDDRGYAIGTYNHEFADMSVLASGYRDPQAGVSGSFDARGSIAFADDHLVLGKATNTTPVVLKAPTLPHETLYQDSYDKPTTRTDGAGYAILPNPLVFKNNRARINDANAPLGLEVPDNALTGTVYPYRGYIVPVATHLARPARLYLRLPKAALSFEPYADVEGHPIPVEADGTLYIEDLGRITRAIVVEWQAGDATKACLVPAEPLTKALAEKPTANVQAIRDIRCEPTQLPRDASPERAVPVEAPAPRLPYDSAVLSAPRSPAPADLKQASAKAPVPAPSTAQPSSTSSALAALLPSKGL